MVYKMLQYVWSQGTCWGLAGQGSASSTVSSLARGELAGNEQISVWGENNRKQTNPPKTPRHHTDYYYPNLQTSRKLCRASSLVTPRWQTPDKRFRKSHKVCRSSMTSTKPNLWQKNLTNRNQRTLLYFVFRKSCMFH